MSYFLTLGLNAGNYPIHGSSGMHHGSFKATLQLPLSDLVRGGVYATHNLPTLLGSPKGPNIAAQGPLKTQCPQFYRYSVAPAELNKS